MTDLGERIRDAVDASVRDNDPPPCLLTAVQSRYRRGRKVRAVIGAAAAMAAIAGAVALAVRPWQAAGGPVTGRHHGHAVLFPGGGRMLLESGARLRWLYPDGRVTWIPGRFDRASVTGAEILAWRYRGARAGYYTMTQSGRHQRRVLPMTWNRQVSVIQAALSPDLSLLAYVRQDIASAQSVTDTLWIKDLATGRSENAGQIAPAGFAWTGSRTLAATSPSGHALMLVNAETGARGVFLTVSDPALIRAYERAQPGAGPPHYIRADGAPGTGWAGRLAVWLAAPRHQSATAFMRDSSPDRPAELVLTGRQPIAAYVPPAPSQLGLIWGPDGLFALQTGRGDLPGSWHAYIGVIAGRGIHTQSPLSARISGGQNGVVFSPGGTVLALNDGGMETLVAVPRPACQVAGSSRCLKFRPMVLPRTGTVQAWLPELRN